MNIRSTFLGGTFILALFSGSSAGSNGVGTYCDSLNDAQMRQQYEMIAREFQVKECCGKSLAECMDSKTDCSLPARLANFTCRLLVAKKEPQEIMEKLTERYRSMTSETTVQVREGLFEPAGDPNAKVIVSVYISGTCPMCKFVAKGMYREVTKGSLRGKARLVIKLLSTNMVDMALLAANEHDKFWPYIIELSSLKERATRDHLFAIGQKVGISPDELARTMARPELIAKAKASREEALRNGVKVTPTVFINGHFYDSYKHPTWITDAVEYEYEKRM